MPARVEFGAHTKAHRDTQSNTHARTHLIFTLPCRESTIVVNRVISAKNRWNTNSSDLKVGIVYG